VAKHYIFLTSNFKLAVKTIDDIHEGKVAAGVDFHVGPVEPES
jgi:hypothetical protein